MKPTRRKIIEHMGQRILLQETPKGRICYSMFKFVNGESLAIHREISEDTETTRDIFVNDALAGFARARAAPFN